MRVPPPGQLKLDRGLLLQDVRERLIERLPHYADRDEDPTDPGWLLLEQAAWLVEMLSEQLDKYPYTVVQQLVHMMGGQLRPAQPSIGVGVAQVSKEGRIELDGRRPSPWRFFTPQDEEMESVEFVPVESGVSLRNCYFKSACTFGSDELRLVGPVASAPGLDGQVIWRKADRPSKVFDTERIRFTAVTNNVDGLMEAFENALKLLEERHVGWLKLRYEQQGREKVILTAEVDAAGAFAKSAPAGIWAGGDLVGDWGTLDGTTWTPSVSIHQHPLLPPHLHGQYPLPGYEEGQILLTDIPENFPVAELLRRKASPMPEAVVEAIWKTLGNLDSRILAVKPSIGVEFGNLDDADDLEPEWIAQLLTAGLWSELDAGQPNTVFHVGMTPGKSEKGSLRVALVFESTRNSRFPKPRFFASDSAGKIGRTRLKAREAWRLSLPPRKGAKVMPTVIAFDVPIEGDAKDVLVISGGAPTGAMVNAFLMGNMPAVADGRSLVIERNVPTDITMLFDDLIDSGVVDQLLEEPIHPTAAAVLRGLALSHFPVADQDAIVDWDGVKLDVSEGALTINAPSADGTFRVVRPGTRLRLDWYRRTDGERGNKPAGAIRLVEQPPQVVPTIDAVTNPLGTYYGADREEPEAAIERLFGPSGGTPVLAADFERVVRQSLGNRGRGWMVRCWTYAERALVSSSLWPIVGPEEQPDADVVELGLALDEAGPDTLLVAIGLPEGVLPDEDLDWARRTVKRAVQRLARRLPTVKDALITRLWPLRMEITAEGEEFITPSFDLDHMAGDVYDPIGRTMAERPKAVVLLNAAVTDVVVREQEVL